ncbi:MAG: methylenetetrahydrofolate reductase [NAD(P)H] [Legionellaceae bacterium]|nr:methylenetetrahydrofolate reductase [NAD(P)H] [Legionellaceae bacterium]
MSLEISFEFFPPKTEVGQAKLEQTCALLCAFQPSYFSVTFGAAGSVQSKTLETIELLSTLGVNTAPHISCIGTQKNDINKLLDKYQSLGVRRLVVLRGDYPEDKQATAGEFNYANELVAYIRHQFNDKFHISVAAYPEFHPQALNAMVDFQHFKYKVNSGANEAITQYFFNIDAYDRLLTLCERANIHVPITPGIMPIANLEKLLRFSALCGAEIPLWLKKRLLAYENDQESLIKFGVDVVSELCEKLIKLGAPGLHFYTLNQAEPTISILKHLNVDSL